ncbi:MAG TPA: bifunctional glycosyltransferase family 2/GtrA family protein [Candidatus Alectryocaccomicrobium excrementavium]|uniref:Bifunctional glycosyltransferase family 2/GtrA family protein n=1 Tax=Candidatus Alectryocaccomicrobium excrementavium TaxID=2840668 RepID=A0A9D1G0E3_9FIRM|nr:bifunctional glycosyltransferase family 2/GtrA family protein [Candidatus Alectryocaccomicrobium excrementavium]
MEGRTYAIVPAYKPDRKLLSLCWQLVRQGYSIVIVNDGSPPEYDNIFAEAAMYGCVLRHDGNLGKGAALKTGLRYLAAKAGAGDVVVTVDADGQHRAKDVIRVAARARREGMALVLGRRTFEGGVPLRSRTGNALARAAFRLLSHSAVTDTQTGLRAFPCALIPFFLEVRGERYEYEMDVLFACVRYGIPIVEEPVDTVYLDGNAASHFRVFPDGLKIFREILSFAASSAVGFCVDYTLFALLSRALVFLGSPALQVSNVLARLASAGVNFAVNRRFVFRAQEERLLSPAVRYFLLAAGILALNTLALTVLVRYCGIHVYLAKILAEAALFVVSWIVQKSFVFRKKQRRE